MRVALLCLLAFLLHGCGLKGPLYLPNPEEAQEIAERERKLKEREQREQEQARQPAAPSTPAPAPAEPR